MVIASRTNIIEKAAIIPWKHVNRSVKSTSCLGSIGRAALPQDTETAKNLLEKGLDWLFLTPWWIPGLLALALTITVIILAVRGEKSKELVDSVQTTSTQKEPPPPLVEIERQVFDKGETVVLDGHKFISCEFLDCTIQYNGGRYQMVTCKIPPNVSRNLVIGDSRIVDGIELLGVLGLIDKQKIMAMAKIKKPE